MNIYEICKKYWNYIISILFVPFLISLLSESLEKVVIITFAIVVWNLLIIFLKDSIKSSFILLLLLLPFNITFQLPYSVFGMELSNPFINGVIVNYLIPTISILDLSVFLLLLSLIFEKRTLLKWKGFSFLKIFTIFGMFLLINSLYTGSFLSLLNASRLLLYLFTFYNLAKVFKDLFKHREYTLILLVSIFLVIFQGFISFLQFRGGTSLGLFFLGESKVVSGMIGSSFITLNNRLFLRGYGTFPHPNVFAGWLIFNILLGWYLFDSMVKKRDYSIILMGISSLVLLLTFSRIAYLVCIVIWICFIVKVFINSKKIKNFAFFGLISERVLNLFTGGDTSWRDRALLMQSSFKVIRDNILMGVGLGRFVEGMGDSVPRSSNGILLLQPVHNIFLLMITEIGVLGLGIFSTLLYFFIKERKWSLRLIMGFVAILIIGMFDHYLVSLPQGLVILFLVVSI